MEIDRICSACEGAGEIRLGDEISEDTGERLGEDVICLRCDGTGAVSAVDPWMTPYQPLPGTVLGPHDSVEFSGDRDVIERERLLLLDGVTWWHHADAPPAGARPKGGQCGGGNLHAHSLAAGTATADDLSSITITPSLLCGACGRHIYITAGQVRDLGSAHTEAKA